ncbi:ankyrin repeat-containing domain protein [Tricladium varicosporioides]|nr:ankyrin repeat-containing domain protein [Hymenoscyphus varicosporioides]
MLHLQMSDPEPPQQKHTSIDEELSDAAEAGFFEQVQSLIDRGASVNHIFDTPLCKAARNGHLDVVKPLLDQGAGASSRRLSRALFEAAIGGHPQVVLLLVDWGAEINPRLGYRAPLLGAIQSGHVGTIELLLVLGANIDAYGWWDRGATPLAEAVRKGSIEIAQLLLDHEASVDGCGGSTTPLTEAAKKGNIEIAQLLLDHGASADGCGGSTTPLIEATKKGNVEIAQLLLDHGASVDKCGDVTTPLTEAAKKGNVEIVQLLLDHGVSVDKCGDVTTPLTEAAKKGNVEIVQLLLDHGASVDGCGYWTTPLAEAAKKGNVEIVQLLLDHGANIDAYGGPTTPLAEAAKKETVKIADLHPDHRTYFGVFELPYRWANPSDPLIEAAKGGHFRVVQLLLDWALHRLDRVTFKKWVAKLVQESIKRGNSFQEVLENILVHSAANGQRQMIDLLLGLGVSINAMTEFGTPLSSSARAGHESIVRRLLRKGADIQGAAIFLQTHFGSETTVARLFEIEGKIRVEDAARKAHLSSGHNAGKVQNLRCLRRKFVAQHILMLQKAEISSTGFRKLRQEFASYQKLWSAGIKTLRMLCNGMVPELLGDIMAFLCLSRAITETLESIDSRDRSDQFRQDLRRWELLFKSDTDMSSYREAVHSMWVVSVNEWGPSSVADPFSKFYDYDHKSLFEFSQLALTLINESRELIELDNFNDNGLENSQYRWRLRNNNSPNELSADSIPEFHLPRGNNQPSPEIIHPRPPDPSCTTTRTLSEEVKADVSTIIKPIVILLMVGAIMAIVILFLQWLRSVSTTSVSELTILYGVGALQECCWITERYIGLKGYSTWIPEHSISLGQEIAPFDDLFDPTTYGGGDFSY